MSQNLGRSTWRDLDFVENVLFDVHVLGMLQGFQLVVHAGKTGGIWQIALAVPGRMTTDGTGLTIGVQNVTPAGPRHHQRGATLDIDLVGILFHLQIVGYKPIPNRQHCWVTPLPRYKAPPALPSPLLLNASLACQHPSMPGVRCHRSDS